MATDYLALIDSYRNKQPTAPKPFPYIEPSVQLDTSQIDDKRGVSGPGIFGGLFNDAKRGAGVVAGGALNVLGALDKPRGGLFGFINNIDQGLGAGLEGAGQGFKDPSQFRGTDILGINNLNDNNLFGTDISLRDTVGLVAEIGLDPINIATAGVGKSVATKLGKYGLGAIAGFAEPVASGNIVRRLGAEYAVGAGAIAGGEVGKRLLPGDKYDWAAQLVGGLAGGSTGAIVSNRILPRDAVPTPVKPFEDVYTVHDVDLGAVELEGQIIKANSVSGSPLIDIRRKLLNEAELEVNNPLLDTAEQLLSNRWIDSWIQNSSNSRIRDHLIELNNGTIDINIEDTLRDLYSKGENFRNSIRKSDPYYNKAKDTTVLYRGESVLTQNASGNSIQSSLNDPQIVQPYTVDPDVAGQYGVRLNPGIDPVTHTFFEGDKLIISREIPVDDIITSTKGTHNEYELIVMDSRKFKDESYTRLTSGKPKSTYQQSVVRDRPYADERITVTSGKSFAEQTPQENIKDLVPIKSQRQINKENLQKVNFITQRDAATGRIISSQRIDAFDPEITRAIALRDDGRPFYQRGSVQIETVGTPTPESIAAARTAKLNEQVAASRKTGESDALKFFEAEDEAIKSRFAQYRAAKGDVLPSGSTEVINVGTIAGESPQNIQIPQRAGGTELPVPTQARAYNSSGNADFTAGDAGVVNTKRRFNPERIRAAPEQIAEALQSRVEQLKTLRKADIQAIATEQGLPFKSSATKAELMDLISINEYKGEFVPLYAGVPEYTQVPSKVVDNISTDMPPLLSQRVQSSYYNMTNGRELPPVLQEIVDKARADNSEVPQDVFERLNQSLKMGNATGDMSWSGIQGLQSISQWAVTGQFGKIRDFVKLSADAVKDPKVINEVYNGANQRAIVMGAPTLDVLQSQGLSLQALTGIEDIGRGLNNPITNVPVVGTAIERTNKLFAIQGDSARITNFYDAWARYGGPNLNDEEVTSIINAVNRMTGVSSKNRLGSHANMILFAPRFFQSQIETLVHAFAFNNSIESRMARRGLGSLIGTGVGVTVLANEMLAMQRDENYVPFSDVTANTDFTPWKDGHPNSNFMRIKNVFGTDVSVFGPWDTLVRGAMSIYDDPVEGTKDVLRSKSSPMLGIAWNLFSGRTFMGEKFDARHPDWNMVEETFLPFAFRDIGSEPLSGNVFGFFGVKATPLTSNEQLTINMRNAGVDAQDPLQRRQWLADHPEDRAKSNDEDRQLSDLVRGDLETRSALNESRALTDNITLVEYRENRRILSRELRNKLDTIFGDDFNTRTPANEKERWIQEYYNLFDSATDPITHDVVGGAFDLLLANWTKTNGPAALEYVNQFNLVGNLKLENEYLSAMSQLNDIGYFDAPRLRNMNSGLDENTIFELRNQVSAARLGNPRLAVLDYSTAAWQVLREQGYNANVVNDVVNAGRDAYQSKEFTSLKQQYPDLIAWFNPNATYSTLQQLRGLSTGATGQAATPYVPATR